MSCSDCGEADLAPAHVCLPGRVACGRDDHRWCDATCLGESTRTEVCVRPGCRATRSLPLDPGSTSRLA